MVEPDVAVDVGRFIGVEDDVAARLGGGLDAYPLGAVLAHRLDPVGRHDGAVEEPLVPYRRADPDEVAFGDLEPGGLAPPGLAAPGGDRDRAARDVRRVKVRAKNLGKGAHLAVRARDDKTRSAGLVEEVAAPVAGKALKGRFEARAEEEPAAGRVGLDGARRFSLADRLGGPRLPPLPGVLAAPREEGLALGLAEELGVGPGLLGRKTVPPRHEVLEIRALAPDGLDPGGPELVDDETKARARLDGLELVEIPDREHLRARALGEVEHRAHLANGEHARLVEDENGPVVEHGPARSHLAKEPREAQGRDPAFGSEVDRGAPRHGACDDPVAAFAVQLRDRPQRDGLARARGPETNGKRGIGAREVMDRGALLLADGVAGCGELAEAPLDGFRGYRVAGPAQRAKGEVLDRVLLRGVVEGREKPGVGKPRPRVRGASRAVRIERDEVVVAKHPGEDRVEALGRDEPRTLARDVLDELREGEHRLVEGETRGELAATPDERAHRLVARPSGDVPQKLGEEPLAVDARSRLFPPGDVALLRIERVLPGPRRKGDLLRDGKIPARVDPELARELLDAPGALRPGPDELLGNGPDPDELALRAVALELDAEPLAKVPRERMAVHRAPPPAPTGRRGADDGPATARPRASSPG